MYKVLKATRARSPTAAPRALIDDVSLQRVCGDLTTISDLRLATRAFCLAVQSLDFSAQPSKGG